MNQLPLTTALLLCVGLMACNKPPATGTTDAETGTTTAPTSTELEYEVLASGDGAEVAKGSYVYAHYTGRLEDGSEFDSSRGSGLPFEVIVGHGFVIPGWDQILQQMRVGDRWEVKVPPELAYGADGFPPVIPPNATLTFDLEVVDLLDVEIEWVTRGTGPEVVPGSTAITHYTGTLLNGTQFDSSRDRGTPYPVQVGARGVIPGWEVALLRMREGDRAKVTIPWQLAYGERGSPPKIPGKSNLIFDLEVVELRPPRKR